MIIFKNGEHYSRNMEVSVLGICLLEPAAFARTKLRQEYFYYEEARTIFTTLQEMHDQSIPIDLLTATDYFQRVKKINEIKDKPIAWVLCKLTNEVVSSGSLKRWCMILTEMWKTRELARATTSTAPQVLARISAPANSGISRKTCRFLLTHISKEILKETLSVYGAKTIRGGSRHRVKVSSPLLVYLMSLVKPEYTWTCTENFDEQMSNEQCKIFIPDNSLLTKTGNGNIWIDKTNQYPAAWN